MNNLKFLNRCSDDDLDFFVQIILTKGSSTETLSSDPAYCKNHPHHSKYVDVIKREILDFGSNTFWFQEGYKTVLDDVLDKMDVSYNSGWKVEYKEEALLNKVFCSAWEEMSENDRKAILESMNTSQSVLSMLLKKGATEVFKELIAGKMKTQFIQIMMPAVAGTMLSVIGRGAATAVFSNALKTWLGPIGWLWTAAAFAGPAYRVTVPCVIWIALLRKLYTQ